MAGLTRVNLRQSSWRIVYDILKGTGVGSVYSKFPETHQISFPMLVIDNVDSNSVAITKDNMAADITVPLTLYNTSGKNLDIRADAAVNSLLGSRAAFVGSAVRLLSITDGGQGTNTYGDTNVHFKALNVNMECLI